MKRLIYYLLISLCAVSLGAELAAQTGDKLEITADGSLEWNRAEQTLTARENAVARRGQATISADLLSADYQESEESAFDITELSAAGNIIIETQDSKAYGETAVYNLDSGLASMTGNNLRLVSADQTLTAEDRFEYHVTSGELRAIGKARLERPKTNGPGGDTLQADTIAAQFTENEQGERVLKQLEARDNVVITTPSETITGTYGTYNAASNKAELTGGVTITRGPNVLEGARATVDLTTNISRLFGDPAGSGNGRRDGRVRGVFYPGSEESP